MTAPLRTATLARLALVAAILALLATLIVRPALEPAGVRARGTLPACRYDDILTSPRGYADWSITLVDTILRVTKTYVPPDLVSVSKAGIAGSGQVRAFVIDDLRAMSQAAAAAAAGIGIQSAYRSYAEQQIVFDGWVKSFGYARALQVSARPGHSEHQLGVAIDFRSEPGGTPFKGTWGSTAAGKWMNAHAWEYGFVMSYPKDKMAVTCYDYEPWHFRYVGHDLAAKIHASGLTPREYLWAHFTTTVVPPPKVTPRATAKPTTRPTAAPTKAPAPSPTATATPSSSPTVPPPTATPALSTATPEPPATPTPTPFATPVPVDPSVAAGAQPILVGIAGITFALIIGGAWLASRRPRRVMGGPG
jgi:D-alanyl-D-alanine carboxypeptidase